MNRGKRGIAVDAHSELGREVMRPAGRQGRRVRHQLPARGARADGPRLRRAGGADNPRLVYARVSGFGPLGPDADKAMLDGAAQARSGLAAISGPADGPPMPPGAAIADHTGVDAAGARGHDRAVRP